MFQRHRYALHKSQAAYLHQWGDYAARRSINITGSRQVVEISHQLKMMEAINNEMDKAGGSSDAVGTYIRNPKTGNLIDISNVPTRIIRVP